MELDLRAVAIWENPPFFEINDDLMQEAFHTYELKLMARVHPRNLLHSEYWGTYSRI